MDTINSIGSRKELAMLFKLLGFRHIAEIGVEQGVYTEVLCQENPKAKIYAVDAWKAHKGYRDHTRQSKLEGFYEITKERLAKQRVQIIRAFSMDAVKEFADESLDAVYIDANHNYENVMKDITEWAKKVKQGGIISGHDYIRRKGQDEYYDVVHAVNNYCQQNGVRALTLWRGDEVPSWSFQKLQ